VTLFTDLAGFLFTTDQYWPSPAIEEVLMHAGQFGQPLSIFVGLGFSRRLDTVADAYKVLAEWPEGNRGAEYRTLLEACRASFTGAANTETVRTLFQDFARARGVLAPDAMAAAALSAEQEWFNP
jgi:hypothetical protein